MELTIYGDPKALQRHRTARKDGKVFSYDPSSNDKRVFAWKAIADSRPKKMIEGPIFLRVTFFMKRPKSHYNSKGELKGKYPFYHINKPDSDNLIKFVKDALNGIYWRDDSQISVIKARKIYADQEVKTHIAISELNA